MISDHFCLLVDRTTGVIPSWKRFLVLLRLTMLKITLWSSWTLSTVKWNQNLTLGLQVSGRMKRSYSFSVMKSTRPRFPDWLGNSSGIIDRQWFKRQGGDPREVFWQILSKELVYAVRGFLFLSIFCQGSMRGPLSPFSGLTGCIFLKNWKWRTSNLLKMSNFALPCGKSLWCSPFTFDKCSFIDENQNLFHWLDYRQMTWFYSINGFTINSGSKSSLRNYYLSTFLLINKFFIVS